ncbi:MAG: hypothetical protein FJX63_04945, partial [Alphaproteobacteria bacterium]|nr:hypothetical protein [Alphaproteobacteria bacterium]
MVEVADRKASGTEFEAAQHWARLAEAAHRDALAQLDNAMAIRLQLLADRLQTELAPETPLTGPIVVAGGRPRLWVDLVLFVEMAPEPRTYQLTLEGAAGREVLFETF